MPKRKRPIFPTIVVLLLLISGICLLVAGMAGPTSKLKFGDIELETPYVGLILVLLGVIVYLIGPRKPEMYPYAPPPPGSIQY